MYRRSPLGHYAVHSRTPQWLSGHIHGHVLWLTHVPFVLYQSVLNFPKLSPWKSESWIWSKGSGTYSDQHVISLLYFRFTLIRPTIPEIQLFQSLILQHPRSRSCVRWKLTWYPIDALFFRYRSVGPIIPEILPIECLIMKNTSEILRVNSLKVFWQQFANI